MKVLNGDGQGSMLGSYFIPRFRMHEGSFMPLGAKTYWRRWLKPDSSAPPTSPLSRSVWPPRDGAIQTCREGERICLWGCICRSSRMLKPGAHFLCQLQGKSHSVLLAAGICKGLQRLAVDLTQLLDVQRNALAHSEPHAHHTSPHENEPSETPRSAIHTLQSWICWIQCTRAGKLTCSCAESLVHPELKQAYSAHALHCTQPFSV